MLKTVIVKIDLFKDFVYPCQYILYYALYEKSTGNVS